MLSRTGGCTKVRPYNIVCIKRVRLPVHFWTGGAMISYAKN